MGAASAAASAAGRIRLSGSAASSPDSKGSFSEGTSSYRSPMCSVPRPVTSSTTTSCAPTAPGVTSGMTSRSISNRSAAGILRGWKPPVNCVSGLEPQRPRAVVRCMGRTAAIRETDPPQEGRNGVETEPKPGATAETDDRSPEALYARWVANPGSFREHCQVYRGDETTPQRQQEYLFEIPCKDLIGAKRTIQNHKLGGRGFYQLVLQDSATGQRARVGYAKVAGPADPTPDEAPATRGPTTSDVAFEALRDQLKETTKRLDAAQNALMSRPPSSDRDNPIIERLMDRADEARERASRSHQEGYDKGWAAGHAMGLIEGKLEARSKAAKEVDKDPWGPAEVKGVVEAVGSALRGGDLVAKAAEVGAAAAVSILDVLRTALETGLSAAQTVRMVAVLRGDDVVRALAQNAPMILQQALQAPELAPLLQQPGAVSWVDELRLVLASVVGSPGDGSGSP